jgi:hypothetical protein
VLGKVLEDEGGGRQSQRGEKSRDEEAGLSGVAVIMKLGASGAAENRRQSTKAVNQALRWGGG